MARVRYLLLTMLLWVFILAWWAGVVLWVAVTGAWPVRSEPAFVWPFWLVGLSMPPLMGYLFWEYLWGQERQRRYRQETVELQIMLERLHRAKKKEQPKAPSARRMKENKYSGKVAKVSKEPSPRALAQAGNGRSLNSEVPQPSHTSRTLASDPRPPTPAAPAMPPTATCAAPRTASASLRCSTRSPSIEGGRESLDDFEETLRQIWVRRVRVDQKGTS